MRRPYFTPWHIVAGCTGGFVAAMLVFIFFTFTEKVPEDKKRAAVDTSATTTADHSPPAAEERPDAEHGTNTAMDVPKAPTVAQQETSTPAPSEPENGTIPGGEGSGSERLQRNCLSAADQPFYVDPTASIIRAEKELREAGKEEQAALLAAIACEPLAVWLMGGRTIEATREKIAEVYDDIGTTGALPVFVLYNQPTPEEAGWESGRSGDSYYEWVRVVAESIGDREAWVILEPDALATTASYDAWQRAARAAELGQAVSILEQQENIRVYIDAGHSHWLEVGEAVALLEMANVAAAHGFSLNVANYRHTDNERAYGTEIAQRLEDKHFVIDTGRNGNGPHEEATWCNAPGRAIGDRPRLIKNDQYLDAYLWVKPPGESDGTCGGGPAAGKFWLPYALGLIENAQ